MPVEAAVRASAANAPVRESRSISAKPANPPPTCQRNSRRERPQGVGLGMKREAGSLGIRKFVEVQNHTAHLFQRGVGRLRPGEGL